MFLLLGLLLLAGCGVSADSSAACTFVREAEVPVEFQGNTPVVAAKVDGKTVHFILDTGSDRTVLSEAAAARLGVEPDSTMHATLTVTGGKASAYAGKIGRLEVATASQTDMYVIIVLQTVFPGREIDGVLGEDVLSKYDIDLDFPHRRLGLYRPRNCPSGGPGWAEPASRLSRLAVEPPQPANVFRATLDGMDLNALLDTGANITTVERKNALMLGVTQTELSSDRQITFREVGPNPVRSPIHRFSSLIVGDETIERPNLVVTPLLETSIPLQIILGDDYLRRHRVWLSYASFTAYVVSASP